jgi:hypothetical protein
MKSRLGGLGVLDSMAGLDTGKSGLAGS